MRQFFLIALLFFSILSLEAQSAKRVIVLPFSGDQSDLVTERFMIELQKTKTYRIIERTELSRLTSELKFQSSDLFDESQMLEIGKYAKAELIMIGAVSGVSGNVTIAVRGVDISTGIIVMSRTENINLDNSQGLAKFAKNIANDNAKIAERLNDSRVLSAVLPFSVNISPAKASNITKKSIDNEYSALYSFIPFGLGNVIRSNKANNNQTTTTKPKKTVTDSDLLTNLFMNQLFSSNDYKFVERANLNKVIDEMKFQENDEFDDGQAIEIGKLSGVKLVFIGRVKETGDDYMITVKGIEVNTGMVELSEYVMAYSIDEIVPKTLELANMLLGKKKSSQFTLQKENPNLWVKKLWGISPTDGVAMGEYYKACISTGAALVGVGIASIVVGGVFAISGAVAYNDHVKGTNLYTNKGYSDYDLAIVLFIIGGVFGGAGVLLAIFSSIPFAIANNIKNTYYNATGNHLVFEKLSVDYDERDSKVSLVATLSF